MLGDCQMSTVAAREKTASSTLGSIFRSSVSPFRVGFIVVKEAMFGYTASRKHTLERKNKTNLLPQTFTMS